MRSRACQQGVRAAALAATVLFSASPVLAASVTANFPVQASVLRNCTVTAVGINFGAYDPVVANATVDKTGAGTITVVCAKGTSGVTIAMDTGANGTKATGTTRAMSDGGGSFLSYELYQNVGLTTTWGTGASALTVVGAINKTGRTFDVFGKVPAGQDVSAGAYNDTVVATVNF